MNSNHAADFSPEDVTKEKEVTGGGYKDPPEWIQEKSLSLLSWEGWTTQSQCRLLVSHGK